MRTFSFSLQLAVLFFVPIGSGQNEESDLLSVHIMFRHGSRIPTTMDRNMIPFWEQEWRYNDLHFDGDLTELGERQLEVIGTWARQTYIDELQFLPGEYYKRFLSVRASSQLQGRVLQSSTSFLDGLYPGAAVPIYSTLNNENENVFIVSNCPSYAAEVEIRDQIFDEGVVQTFPELLSNITAVTDLPLMLKPHDLLMRCRDNMDQAYAHGIVSHPYLEENKQLIIDLADEAWELRNYPNENDTRGGIGARYAELLMQNLESSDETRMYIYGSHGNSMLAIYSSLGLPYHWSLEGDTLIIEKRRHSQTGQIFLIAKTVRLRPHNTMNILVEEQHLTCPEPREICDLNDFVSYAKQRNPIGTGEGCCLIGDGFYRNGCDNYFNPDALNNPICKTYRIQCPEIACGNGNFVDRATNLCVARAMS